MSSNVPNIAPFLTTSRQFNPESPGVFVRELTKAYLDTAIAVNLREIALYDTVPIITGQQWTSSNPQQKNIAFRQVFTAPSILNGTTSITHNIPVTATTLFTHIYGVANNAPSSFLPLPFVDNTSIANCIRLEITATQILITTSVPTYTAYSATIILEYILNVI